MQRACTAASALISCGSVKTRWQYGTSSNSCSRAARQASRWRQLNHRADDGSDIPVRYFALGAGCDGRVIVIGRDLVIIGGTIAYHFLVGPVQGEPTRASKLNTVLQILFILLTINHAWLGWPTRVWLETLGAAILVTIGISTVQYVTTGFSRVRDAKRQS